MHDDDFPAQLRALPPADRAEALQARVVAEFRQALMLTDAEPMPLDENYFDLGLSSLRIEEVKQRLEAVLQCPIDADTLFNHPTVAHLLSHLRGGPLAALFPADAPDAPGPTADDDEALAASDLLSRLLRG
jgi:aryl carrier-like protein